MSQFNMVQQTSVLMNSWLCQFGRHGINQAKAEIKNDHRAGTSENKDVLGTTSSVIIM